MPTVWLMHNGDYRVTILKKWWLRGSAGQGFGLE